MKKFTVRCKVAILERGGTLLPEKESDTEESRSAYKCILSFSPYSPENSTKN